MTQTSARLGRCGERLEHGAHPAIGVGFTEVGDVTGDDDRVERGAVPFELPRGLRERAHRVGDAAERSAAVEQMGVAHVRDHLLRRRIPAELWMLHLALPQPD